MQTLNLWATYHNIPPAALADLYTTLGLLVPTPATANPATSEAGVQQAVRLEAARRGARLWRNNTGVAQDERGNIIRYGLCNESKQVNAVCKSSDLIGVTPVRCGCGQVYGVFTAVECKAPGWKFRPTDQRANAQLAFGKLVMSLGGMFKFVTNVDEY